MVVTRKSEAVLASYSKGAYPENMGTYRERSLVLGQFRRTTLRIHADQENSPTLTANMGTGGNNVPIILGMALRNRGE